MSSDVGIVGAGVVGLSCAVRCAIAGLDVTVFDPEPGRGASWAAAGMIAPVTELHYGEDALLRLNVAASERWPGWADHLAEHGVDVGYHRCGSMLVARDADDAAELRRLLATHETLGLDVTWLRSREARQAEPSLAPSTRGALSVPGDHQVDNRALVTGLLAILDMHPRVELDRRAVRGLRLGEGRIAGVGLDDGTDVDLSQVVVTAGAATTLIDGIQPHVEGIRPVKGQLLHLRSPDGPLATANIRGMDCYIVNRPDGRIVVGATVEEMGFDTTVTAGGVSRLLRAAWELMPGIDECALVETTAGIRPGTPDNAPLIGPVDGMSGLTVAAGHYRNGVLQSALTADIVLGLLAGDAPSPWQKAVTVDRFVTAAPE